MNKLSLKYSLKYKTKSSGCLNIFNDLFLD